MADQVDIVVRLREAAQASRDARTVERGIKGIGDAATTASRKAAALGPAVDRGVSAAERGFGRLARSMRTPVLTLGALGAAGTAWGLGFNAQVESARLRFKLFTNDVDGLVKAVGKIDDNSAFNLTGLSDAAATLGNARVRDIPGTLQGIANAAAASGKGEAALDGITRAVAQIGAKGTLSMEEVQQLQEQMAPGVWDAITKRLGVTKDEMANLGGEGISGRRAIKALVAEWTSGDLERAAKDATGTLAGQWDLFTGNAQKASGALTAGLAAALGKDVLPAANRALQGIKDIFESDTLAPQEKLQAARALIDKELGPIAEDLKDAIDKADIPEHLGDVIGKAVPFMADAAAEAAPKAAEAFVQAWLHAGIPAQLATVLYLGAKGGKLARNLGLGKLGGLLGKGLDAAKPIPVWVTNPGFGGPGVPGTPAPAGAPGGRGKLGTPRGASVRGAGAAAAASFALGEIVNALPISDDAKAFINGPSEEAAQSAFDEDMAARFGTPHRRGLIGQVALTSGAADARTLIGAVQQAVTRQPFEVNTRHVTILKVEQRELARSVDQWRDRQNGRKG